MMPADRHAHMIEALSAHEGKFISRTGHAPVLARRRFKVIAEIDAVHEPPGGLVRGRIGVREWLHCRRIGRDKIRGVSSEAGGRPKAQCQRGNDRNGE